MKYLEFQVGYYARGYEFETPDPSRNIYAAIGINLSELLRSKTSFKKSASLLNYIQLPLTYLDHTLNLNR